MINSQVSVYMYKGKYCLNKLSTGNSGGERRLSTLHKDVSVYMYPAGWLLDRETRKTGKWLGIFLIFDKKRFLFVLNVLHEVIMHFEIPALFLQSEQATWAQQCEAALGCCLQRSLEHKIFSFLTVTATLTIVDFVISVYQEKFHFRILNNKCFKTLKDHCINCYLLENIFLTTGKKFPMSGNYFRWWKRSPWKGYIV